MFTIEIKTSTYEEQIVESNTEYYKVYADKAETFSCEIELEGANLKDTEVRLVLESDNWKMSHQKEEYRKLKREQSILLNKLGKINSTKSSLLISKVKRLAKNYNSKKISVYGIIWKDIPECFRDGKLGLTKRQLRYRAISSNYPDIFYLNGGK